MAKVQSALKEVKNSANDLDHDRVTGSDLHHDNEEIHDVTDDPTIDVSDTENIFDDSTETRSNSFQRWQLNCPIILEPMMVTFMLVHFPLTNLIPEYIKEREWLRLTGFDNFTQDRNKCLGHENGTTGKDDPYQGNLTLATGAASYFDLEINLVSTFPALFAIMFLGPYSDKSGRKYAILPPVIGQAILVLISSLTAAFSLPKELILVGYFIYGCTGLGTNLLSACYSYIADRTTLEQRSFRIVMGALSIMISAMLSTAGSGFLVDQIGFAWMFFCMFCLNFIIIFYVIFLVPETVHPKGHVQFFKLEYMKKAFSVVLVDVDRRRWKILIILAALITERMVAGSASIDVLFSMNKPLCWGTKLIGVYTSIRHGVSMVGSGGTMWLLKSCFKDEWFCSLACVSALVANVFKFFVTTSAMMFGSAALEFALPLLESNLRSMLTKVVTAHEIGAIQSSVAVIEIVCKLVGKTITNPLYVATQQSGHPSAVFLYMAAWFMTCLVILGVYMFLTRPMKSPGVKGVEKVI